MFYTFCIFLVEYSNITMMEGTTSIDPPPQKKKRRRKRREEEKKKKKKKSYHIAQNWCELS